MFRNFFAPRAFFVYSPLAGKASACRHGEFVERTKYFRRKYRVENDSLCFTWCFPIENISFVRFAYSPQVRTVGFSQFLHLILIIYWPKKKTFKMYWAYCRMPVAIYSNKSYRKKQSMYRWFMWIIRFIINIKR